jgi:hypothetical protein
VPPNEHKSLSRCASPILAAKEAVTSPKLSLTKENMNTYQQPSDWFNLKLDEQRELSSAEVTALRRTVEEQHKSLQRIYKIMRYELMLEERRLHYILKHFEEPLIEMYELAKQHMGKL